MYKLAPVDVVENTVREVLDELLVVEFQEHLLDLVAGRIKAVAPTYRISGKRMRRIVAYMDGYTVKAHCRVADSPEEKRPYKACPVCGSKLKPIKNETLYGWEVTIGQRCGTCSFWTGEQRRVPVRYTFHRAQGKKRSRRGVRRMNDRM